MPKQHYDDEGVLFNTPHSYSWEKLWANELVLVERNLLAPDHLFFTAPVVIASVSPDPSRVLVDAWGVVIWRSCSGQHHAAESKLDCVPFPAELKLYYPTAEEASAAVDRLFEVGDLDVLLEPGLWEEVIEYGASVRVCSDRNGRACVQLPSEQYYARFDRTGAKVIVERGDRGHYTTKNLWRARRGSAVLTQDDRPAWFVSAKDARWAADLYERVPDLGDESEFSTEHIYSWR